MKGVDAVSGIAQALGLSLASGISFYATVAFVGLAGHLGWIGPLPGALGALENPWVFGVAGVLAAIESLALLVPGLATTWEALHTAVRPFGAALLAVLATWGGEDSAIVAGLLGGALGLGTHVAKLGVRAAIDTSPEPVTNAAATGVELGAVALIGWAIWEHPWVALAVAIALLAVLVLLVRAVVGGVRRVAGRLFERVGA
jgi:hypothetical protein